MNIGASHGNPTQRGANRQRLEVLLNMACDVLTETGVLALRSQTLCAQLSVTKNDGIKKTAATRMVLLRAVETAAEWLLALSPINEVYNAALEEVALSTDVSGHLKADSQVN